MKTLLALPLGGAKLVRFGKLLSTGSSMLISVFAYALAYGWRYAVGFVALLFCHEMGHYVAARQRGLDMGAPTFIPFVGTFLWRPSPLLIIIALLAAPHVWRSLKGDPAAVPPGYYDSATAQQRFEYALLYLGLTTFLAVMAYDVHEMLQPA